MSRICDLHERISQLLPQVQLCFDEPLNKHTSFRVGGPAQVMALPKNREELAAALRASALLDCTTRILGAGTNILAPDEGVDGLVICLKDCLSGMEQTAMDTIRVMAGVTMTRCAVFAANLGLSGLEFAHGIPGTVGGGVYMNAGAYGGEIKDVCTSVELMDLQGKLYRFSGEEMGFSYRHSVLEDRPYIVISADFRLEKKPVETIKEKMRELMRKRSSSQPLDLPSAGSAFKRPAQGYAAALIDNAGLRGFRIGNAGVSEKHAGFVVNLGGATAADVKAVLEYVQDKVLEEAGIRLEPEVRIW